MRRLMLSCALAAIGAWAMTPAPATAAPRPTPGPVADAVTAKLLGSADAATARTADAQQARITVTRTNGRWAFGIAVLPADRSADAHPTGSVFLARADEVLGTGGLLMSLLKLAERDGQPSWFRPWLEAERQAQQLRTYQPTLVPGLLQTENYARAMIRTDDLITDDEVERRLGVRLDRQSILSDPGRPRYIAVIEESVLRRADEGYRGLMAEQIAHLIECAERPHIGIHIVPTSVTIHVGLVGPFALARGTDGGWVGHLEN